MADIARIVEIWQETRRDFGADGPFLYGSFSAADAVFAPIVSRFWAYDVAVPDACRSYMDAVQAMPAYQQWLAEGEQDPWRNEKTDAL